MEKISLDRLAGIIAFARVASLGSYTAASRVLSISPSAVSKSIFRLEERLGVKLFNRSTRSITLTPEGADLYQRALRLLREAEEIEQAAFLARDKPSGILRITAPCSPGSLLLAPKLAEFRSRFPDLKVELRLSDVFTDLTEEGIDIAVRIGPTGDSRLIAKKLGPNWVCLYTSQQYINRHGMPTSLEELNKHDLVSVRLQSSGQILKWNFNINGEQVEYLPEGKIIVNSTDAALAVIRSGGGIGLLPAYIASQHVRVGELIPVMSEIRSLRNDFIAYWPESRRGNPNVRVFVDFLTEVFPQKLPWDTI